MKFSPLNVDFSSPCPDPLCSRRPAHTGDKEEYYPKKWLFFCYWLVSFKNGCRYTDMLLITTSTDDMLFNQINIDDLE